MNNYKKLKTLCHQNYIGSEKCGECEGSGQRKSSIEELKAKHLIDYLDNLCLNVIGKTIEQQTKFIDIDLTKDHKDWSEETLQAIIDIVK